MGEYNPQFVERVDFPGVVVDVAGEWHAVTDRGRTLHVVIGEVRFGARAVCGQAVDREAHPLDGNRLCRRCERLTATTVHAEYAPDTVLTREKGQVSQLYRARSGDTP